MSNTGMEGDGTDAAAAATDPIRPALVEIIDAVLAVVFRIKSTSDLSNLVKGPVTLPHPELPVSA
jgi:hypothetical protein